MPAGYNRLTSDSLKIGILGPLVVERDGTSIALGPKQRTLLAILLVNGDGALSGDRIAEQLYDRPGHEAPKALHVHVSRLRKALGESAVKTEGGGYRLGLDAVAVDSTRFVELADAGRSQLERGDAGAASKTLSEALALWRGPALAEFAYADFAQAAIARLEERRLAAVEDRIEAELALGRHDVLVGELEELVREHPVRERLTAQLMLSLYRSGRQAEALDAYQRTRGSLVDELGIDPGRPLRDLHQAILQQDPALDVESDPPRRPPLRDEIATPPVQAREVDQRESRKTVTALAAAISGQPAHGSALDPEALRRVTTTVFTEVSEAVARHDGKVQSVSAESMSAVFGVPEVHEDDALRALRAAGDIHARLGPVAEELLGERGIDLRVRIGICTGEVVVGGDAGAELLVTGAPFIRAERLAHGADTGDTLLDGATARLAGTLVESEEVTIGEWSAFRLSRLEEAVHSRSRFRAPMVGRDRERRRLADAYEQAVADRSCQLFTILGAAGVGKSRLVQEFLAQLGEAPRVARGRCLPYGEGITYWPVLEAVRDLIDVDETAPETTAARVAALIPSADGAERIGEHVAELIGLAEIRSTADERATAIQRVVEELGREAPLVLVFDDIHWGEETFLDLVEYLADWCRDTTVLLVCMARPELFDLRPSWGGGKLNATSVLLEPLSDADCNALVGHLLGGTELPENVKSRITNAAEGNPLFVEEMVAMLVDDGVLELHGTRWVATADLTAVPVPPTISGLLAARLDRLPSAEREVIERAAVEGRVCHRSSVEALSQPGDEASVGAALAALVRKELIRPDRPDIPGEEAYRFRHLLIRDAAYDSIPKQLRVDLHERHAAWLEQRVGNLAVEYDEIIGYHLEQAYGYRAQLGPVDDEARAVGRRAAHLLGAAGRRAFLRSDAPAGANLLARAVAMLRPEDPLRVELVPNVRTVQGLADLSWADRVLTEAIEASATTGDRALAAHALVQRGLLRLFSDPSVTSQELLDVSQRAIGVFEELHDELGLARAWRLAAQAHYLDRRAGRCAEASERALEHVRRTQDSFEEQEIIEWLVIALILGPTPAPEAISRCEQLLSEAADGSVFQAEILAVTAPLLAMQRRDTEADAAFERATAIMEHAEEWVWIALFWHSWVNVWRGTPGLSEAELRVGYDALKAIGEKSHFSSLAHALAAVVYDQGRYDEAERLTEECEAASRSNDVHSQIAWRSLRGRVFAQRGDVEAGEDLARDAIEFGASSDFLIARAEAFEALAEVLDLGGRRIEAATAFHEALALYEQKANELAADNVRAKLAGLDA